MGGAIDFSGVSLGFTVADLVQSTFNFLALFTPFILCGLAVAFAPRILNFIKSVIRARSGKSG